MEDMLCLKLRSKVYCSKSDSMEQNYSASKIYEHNQNNNYNCIQLFNRLMTII